MTEAESEAESLNRFHYRITLQMRCFEVGGPKQYRWKRSDGVWVSPIFTDAEQARDYPKLHGLIPHSP